MDWIDTYLLCSFSVKTKKKVKRVIGIQFVKVSSMQ